MNEGDRNIAGNLAGALLRVLDKGDHWIHGRLTPFLSDIPVLDHITPFTQFSSRGLLLAVIGFALLVIVIPVTERLLRRTGLCEINFRGERIPQSFGLAILLWLAMMLSLDGYLLQRGIQDRQLWLACSVGFGLLGLLDDIRGDKKIKGFRGHFRVLLLERRVTTGLLKAVGGLALSIWVAVQIRQPALWMTMVSALVIALSANAMNLFDLRPGRAGAVFCVSSVLLLYVLFYRENAISTPSLLYVLIPAAVVWLKDAKGQVMLGDTGSNLLGGALGLGICKYTGAATQIAVCVGLVAITILAERISITALIQRHAILRKLDSLTGVRG